MEHITHLFAPVPEIYRTTLPSRTSCDCDHSRSALDMLCTTDRRKVKPTRCARFLRENFATLGIALLCCGLTVTSADAKHNSQHPLTNEEWQEVMEKVSLLDSAVLIPSLLPVIMTNRDALGLSEEQFDRLDRWRKTHYVNMVNIMNAVIEKRVQFRIESLSTSVSEQHLIAFQNEIQRLERDLLLIRLSCRAIVTETFTQEQWETLEFLVADDPKLGSLISQRNGIGVAHKH